MEYSRRAKHAINRAFHDLKDINHRLERNEILELLNNAKEEIDNALREIYE